MPILGAAQWTSPVASGVTQLLLSLWDPPTLHEHGTPTLFLGSILELFELRVEMEVATIFMLCLFTIAKNILLVDLKGRESGREGRRKRGRDRDSPPSRFTFPHIQS